MKKRRIYVINQRQEETYDAAGKAMRDVFSVLREKNAHVIWSVPKRCSRYLKILDLPYLAFFLLFCVGANNYIFYSIPENYIKIKLIKKLRAVKKYKMICFINDMNAHRFDADQGAALGKDSEELSAVSFADYVLVPNLNTKKLLSKKGVSADMVPVGIWDYRMKKDRAKELCELRKSYRRDLSADILIAFAGNLNKSEFLTVMELPRGLRMELWGRLDEEKKKSLPKGCHYNGVLSSDEIPFAICKTDYGLVWDGTGKDEIEGGLGEYLRYNNSHKCALYLASGIPVIVWSESGMAHFVKEFQCGITIDRLSDLAEKTAAADYESMRRAAEKVSSRLQQGYYLKTAIEKILQS